MDRELFTKNYDYALPDGCIATTPVHPRDHAKLLVYDRKNDKVTHTTFTHLLEFLPKECDVFLNDTRVIKARIFGHKKAIDNQGGGKVELLFNKPLDAHHYLVLIRGKVKIGTQLLFDDALVATVTGFNEDGSLDLEDTDKYFTAKTKFVAVIHQSNVLGTINPVKDIVRMAHDVGAVTLVDGAQWVPHGRTDIQDIDCDFYAFSGHKMLGPTGIGILYGKPELLEKMQPFQGGGEMIRSVTMERATWNDIPYKFEAGTPNIAQAIGLGAAVKYIQGIGLDVIQNHGRDLTKYAMKKLTQMDAIKIHGNQHDRGPVISFEVTGVHPHDLAQFLDQDGIAIRAGQLCAQPIMDKLGVFATNRASFYIYNNEQDIDTFCESIEKTAQIFA
jgi:SufS family cysteine desulfurase